MRDSRIVFQPGQYVILQQCNSTLALSLLGNAGWLCNLLPLISWDLLLYDHWENLSLFSGVIWFCFQNQDKIYRFSESNSENKYIKGWKIIYLELESKENHHLWNEFGFFYNRKNVKLINAIILIFTTGTLYLFNKA